MSLKRFLSSMLWASTSSAFCLVVLAGCGGDDLRCGDGTYKQRDVCLPSPEEPAPPVHDTSLTITSFEVPDGPILENHKMRARLGIKGNGDGEHFTLNLGLMEAPPVEGELPPNLSNCLLVGEHIYVKGDGKEQFIDLDFTVGADCHQGKHHNFFLSYASEEGAGRSAGQAIVFSARDAQKEQNQQCRKPSGEAGCVYDVEVQASPGLDMHVTEIVPSSRVGILYPDTSSEHAPALLTVGTEITLHGRDRNDSADIPSGGAYLTYSIAPHRGDTTDWQLLDLDDTQDGTPSTHYPISRLSPHEPLHMSNHLHVTQAVQDKLRGAWAQENVFNLRACVESGFEQEGARHSAGEDGTANDCQVITIQLVRASTGTARQQASIQAWNYTWSQTYGGGTLSLTPSFSTTNVIDLTGSQIPQANQQPQQGAMAMVNGQANLGGRYVGSLAKTPLFQGSAQAVAYVAVNNSFVSVNVNAFGVNLYGLNKKVDGSNPLYERDWNVMKERCENSTYVVVAIPVTLQFCGSGTIGLKARLDIGNSGVQGQTGQGGRVQGTATPYATLGASASASVGLPGASIGVQGSLTLLGVEAPLTTTLDWGLSNLSPMAMNISGDASWALQLNTLSGEIRLVLTYPSAHWCSGWWDIPYPCGPWSDTYTDPLYAFDGMRWNKPFLNVPRQTLSLSL